MFIIPRLGAVFFSIDRGRALRWNIIVSILVTDKVNVYFTEVLGFAL
jgi:hypothetical protein